MISNSDSNEKNNTEKVFSILNPTREDHLKEM